MPDSTIKYLLTLLVILRRIDRILGQTSFDRVPWETRLGRVQIPSHVFELLQHLLGSETYRIRIDKIIRSAGLPLSCVIKVFQNKIQICDEPANYMFSDQPDYMFNDPGRDTTGMVLMPESERWLPEKILHTRTYDFYHQLSTPETKDILLEDSIESLIHHILRRSEAMGIEFRQISVEPWVYADILKQIHQTMTVSSDNIIRSGSLTIGPSGSQLTITPIRKQRVAERPRLIEGFDEEINEMVELIRNGHG